MSAYFERPAPLLWNALVAEKRRTKFMLHTETTYGPAENDIWVELWEVVFNDIMNDTK